MMYLLMNAIDSPWRNETFFHRFYVTHLLDVKENGTYSSVVNIERAYLEHPLWPDDYFFICDNEQLWKFTKLHNLFAKFCQKFWENVKTLNILTKWRNFGKSGHLSKDIFLGNSLWGLTCNHLFISLI